MVDVEASAERTKLVFTRLENRLARFIAAVWMDRLALVNETGPAEVVATTHSKSIGTKQRSIARLTGCGCVTVRRKWTSVAERAVVPTRIWFGPPSLQALPVRVGAKDMIALGHK